ncbi:Na(+)-translocating NADH-quinone reductase subunit C [Serratia odorifera]|uniref:Na(+)-translocating NADH-quinone reductase subunit C n=1 Tax=Serratia odorifera DSM 4582 TaxID=667129 RepID=D4DWM9_SEROD|nr:Na(+)-translocating NADH-quinone reductase subunit C [Serratia odorifera]EFE98001.1 NADH:ubiquinone oxidoreductase, Na(+)-translocating, C subunit [Serratia odorifera DSM 4582]MBJ2065829.1 Na(+)-translocating NADH-quinone reductase subunit C [Serratia odorifera]PNK92449.1 NADH:ubiquinone reductase (Na(+)-transporting) subunit C [Serratia odorifera]RII73601.1 Na(+)-translocating NADH-quinone reductase subunit C [Serratia odorifera]HEJ9095523.1 Na(+)-translocating NADH-quinone reductase subun
MANEAKNDSIGKTLLVVLLLCLVCSVVVAGAAVGLKSKQQEQKLLDKQRNILDVAGLLTPGMPQEQVKQTFGKRIEPRLLDLNSGEFVAGNATAFDLPAALRDDSKSVALPASQDYAGIKRRSNHAEIYLVRDDAGAVNKIVLPVYGTGLWSMMYAFVALDSDGNTVKGITYYDQGETPGLGGEVENPSWRQQWIGKKLFDDNGEPAIRVVKGGARAGDVHGVDGLSGATLTSNGVQHTFDFWLGEQGFGPFLKKVREGALKNG